MAESIPKGLVSPHQPASHCETRIINLQDLDIPSTATDDEYRNIYRSITTSSHPSAVDLRAAIESIKYGLGPPVAFPTETVYGLGHTATSTPGVLSIFSTKGRPSDNPLIVHASSLSHLERMLGGPLPTHYLKLVHKFWPGPLTVLLPVPPKSIFSSHIHPGQETIAFRIPSSKYARFFIAACDLPIAGPSANSSGKPSPTTAGHVFDDLKGKINFILDGGSCDVGVESTVVDGLNDPPLILRPGGVSLAEVRALGGIWAKTAIGYKRHRSGRSSAVSTPNGTGISTPELHQNGELDEESDEHVLNMNGAPRAPGMKYRHYAPQARLILFSRLAVDNNRVHEKLEEISSAVSERQLNIGIITRRWKHFAGLTTATQHNGDSITLDESSGFSNPTTNGDAHNAALKIETSTSATTSLHSSQESSVTFHEAHLGPSITHLAHSLFFILRKFDELGCDYIFAEMVEAEYEDADETVVDAVVDRMGKAAWGRVEE